MPKKRALKQIARNRRAIHGNKRTASAIALAMHGSRNQFLPSTRLSNNQHRRMIRRSHLLNLRLHPHNRLTLPYQRIQTAPLPLLCHEPIQPILHPVLLFSERLIAHRAPNSGIQLLHLERLIKKIKRTFSQRPKRILRLFNSCNYNHFGLRSNRTHPPKHLKPIHLRHLHIRNHNIHILALHHLHTPLPIRRFNNRMPSRNEKFSNRSPNMCIIIDHQDRHTDLLIHSYTPLPKFTIVCF